jgi:hypothetical protein
MRSIMPAMHWTASRAGRRTSCRIAWFLHHHEQRLPVEMTKPWVVLAAALVPACGSNADQFVRPMAPVVALVHVRVIDGTGGPGKDDQTVIVEGGRISQLGDAAAVSVPPGASALDLRGRTVIPGVFKDGVAYDPERLVAAAEGTLGEFTFERLFSWPVISIIVVLGLLVARRAARIYRRRQSALSSSSLHAHRGSEA